MKNIKYLKYEDLVLVSNFFSLYKDEFIEFSKIGWSNKNIENHFKKENNFSIGYFYKYKLCGILIGEKIINDKKFDLDIHIMFVSKHIRRNNIGSSILNFIENNKNLNDISKIYLEVSEHNLEAIRFYEKNNFVFLKFRHNYYIDNNKTINAKCYTKII